MNNTFNIKRFGLLINKDIQENGKKYSLSLLTLFGILFVFLFWISYSYYNNPDHFIVDELNAVALRIASLLFVCFGLFFSSTAMDIMNDKTKKISYLSIPASSLEKFLSRWLIVTIGYIIAFFIALWVADLLRVFICSFYFPDMNVKSLDFSRLIDRSGAWHGWNYAFPDISFFQGCIAVYFLFQSIFFLGAFFWEKNSFIKTFSVIILIATLFILVCRWAILGFYGDFNQFGNMLNYILPSGKYDIAEKDIANCLSLSLGLLALINWVIAYFRFKESEIIKRW